MAQECLSLIRVESDLYFDVFLPLKKFICAGLILLVRYQLELANFHRVLLLQTFIFLGAKTPL